MIASAIHVKTEILLRLVEIFSQKVQKNFYLPWTFEELRKFFEIKILLSAHEIMMVFPQDFEF